METKKLLKKSDHKPVPEWQLQLNKALATLSSPVHGLMGNANFVTFEYEGAKYKVMEDGVRKGDKLVHRSNCVDYFINLE